MIKDSANKKPCPCGTGKTYVDCCYPFITHQQLPMTPETLMRSRYTAYTQINLDYIAETMRPPAANNFDLALTKAWAESIHWVGLDVIRTTHDANKGMVEFNAYYLVDKKKNVLHEISEFRFEDGQWFYVDGIHPSKKIGRNHLCPCGSLKKYKKCCGLR